MKVVFSALILALVPLVALGLGTRQRVIAKGRLLCGTQAASNVYVKLVDEDDGPDPDDDMADTRTNSDGEFHLDGTETEMTNIDPVLKIYHDCNDGIMPCQRKWRFKIPNKYINSQGDSSKVIDIGTWNLEMIADDEERDCIH